MIDTEKPGGAGGDLVIHDTKLRFQEGDIGFYLGDGTDVLVLRSNGDILVHGRMVENDKEVVQAFREWLDTVKR